MPYLIVFAGGALGSLARYSIGLATNGYWQLLIVNVLGTLLLGWVSAKPENTKLNQFLGTGFAGGFTTLSAVSIMVTSVTQFETYSYLLGMLAAGFGSYLLGRKFGGAK